MIVLWAYSYVWSLVWYCSCSTLSVAVVRKSIEDIMLLDFLILLQYYYYSFLVRGLTFVRDLVWASYSRKLVAYTTRPLAPFLSMAG